MMRMIQPLFPNSFSFSFSSFLPQKSFYFSRPIFSPTMRSFQSRRKERERKAKGSFLLLLLFLSYLQSHMIVEKKTFNLVAAPPLLQSRSPQTKFEVNFFCDGIVKRRKRQNNKNNSITTTYRDPS